MKHKIEIKINKTTQMKYEIILVIKNSPVKYEISMLINKTLVKHKIIVLIKKNQPQWSLNYIVISHILITIQWVKIRTQKSYSVKQNHIPPPRKTRGFSRQSYHSLTGKRQRHLERINCRRPLQVVVDVVFKCLRQRSNGFKICLPAVFYMYVFSLFHSV